MTIGEFCETVAAGGLRYNGYCVSWGRNPSHNTKVNGHPDSFHLLWLAADVVFLTDRGADRAQYFYRRMGLHVKRSGPHTLHIQPVRPGQDVLGRPVPEDTS